MNKLLELAAWLEREAADREATGSLTEVAAMKDALAKGEG